MVVIGVVTLLAAGYLAPAILIWLVPVAVPMLAAPAIDLATAQSDGRADLLRAQETESPPDRGRTPGAFWRNLERRDATHDGIDVPGRSSKARQAMHDKLEPGAPRPVTVPSARDPRIDVLRGIALVMIFINHVPGQRVRAVHQSQLGLFRCRGRRSSFFRARRRGWPIGPVCSSAPYWPGGRAGLGAGAERFISCICPPPSWRSGSWRRRRCGLVFTISCAPSIWRPHSSNPLGVLIGIPTLGHQLGYFNILPLYLVLLLVTPLHADHRLAHGPGSCSGFRFWCGSWRASSASICPIIPIQGGWFFNPFSWQILFAAGLATGIMLKRGERLVPKIGWLMWVCGLYLAVRARLAPVSPGCASRARGLG